MRSMLLKNSLLLITLTCLIIACTKVPFTNRKQVTGLYSTDQILEMSYQAYQTVLDSVPLSNDEDQVAMVKRVGANIQAAAEQLLAEKGQTGALAGFEWDYNLIQNDTLVNAWCMPGGKVAFYTAILEICEDETGVAVVMGHEIAHAIAKHGQERINQGAITNTALNIGSVALGQNPSLGEKLIFYGMGYGSQFGMLKFSRTHESESDEIGLYLMAAAGYDPKEAPMFWERMSAGGQEPPEFLSTHPNHSTRVADLERLMPKAMAYYEASQK